MVLAALFSCSASPLADVPIEGGTRELRDAVRAEIEFFEDAAGPGRVELRAVVVEPPNDRAGSYTAASRTVRIAEDASVGRTMRHELCHALVDQTDLREREPRTIERVADVLFDPAYPYPTEDLDASDPRDAAVQWSEAVAQLCEHGPYWASDTLDNHCPRIEDFEVDPELTEEAAAWMLEHVWVPFRRPEPLVLDPAAEIAADTDTDAASIGPTADPRVVAVTEEDGRVRRFDLYDGTELESDLPALESSTHLPTGLGMWSAPGSFAGWPDGPAGRVANWMPLPVAFGGTVRTLAHDGVEWRFVGDGCGGADRWMFTADDAVWMAWHGPGGLTWTELGRRHP